MSFYLKKHVVFPGLTTNPHTRPSVKTPGGREEVMSFYLKKHVVFPGSHHKSTHKTICENPRAGAKPAAARNH